MQLVSDGNLDLKKYLLLLNTVNIRVPVEFQTLVEKPKVDRNLDATEISIPTKVIYLPG